MQYIICSFFMLSFTGFAYILLKALFTGAESYSGIYSEKTSQQFEDVFLFIPPKQLAEAGWAVSAITFITVFLIAADFSSMTDLILPVLFAAAIAIFALFMPRGVLAILKKRRLILFNTQLVDALISMSNALKAGFSITQAFETIVKEGQNPIAQEFNVCLQQTRVGLSFSDALANLETRVASEDLSLVVSATETARKTGGSLTEVFESISAVIRERMRIENRIRTLTAQGKIQGIVVGCMPAAVLALMLFFRPQTMLPFIHSPEGLIIMAIVVLQIICGALIIRKIINIDI